MMAFFLAMWLYLLVHAGIGEAIKTPEDCHTDTECQCTEDCLE
jgi:hypothetical protein